MEGIDHDVIERMARNTEGFSGREIMKMVVAWHDASNLQASVGSLLCPPDFYFVTCNGISMTSIPRRIHFGTFQIDPQ